MILYSQLSISADILSMSISLVKPARAAAWFRRRRAPRGRRRGSDSFGRASTGVGTVSPVSSTSCCCSIRRRKFGLWTLSPANASTQRCNCSSVKTGGISSKTTGIVFDLGAYAARCPSPECGDGRRSSALRAEAPSRVARLLRRASGDEACLVEQLVALQNESSFQGRPSRPKAIAARVRRASRQSPSALRPAREAGASPLGDQRGARRRDDPPTGSSRTRAARPPARRRRAPRA